MSTQPMPLGLAQYINGERTVCAGRPAAGKTAELTKVSPETCEVLGWAISYCCSALEAGRDPRTIEIPEIMRAFETVFRK